MRNKNYGYYAVAVAIVLVGALWAGLPVSALGFGLILVCPLMMFFMMRGMHGGQDTHDGPDVQGHHDDAAGRPGLHDHSGMR